MRKITLAILTLSHMDRTDKMLEWIMQMDGQALWQAAVSFFFTAQIPQFFLKGLIMNYSKLISYMDRTDKKFEWIMQMDGRAFWQAAVSFFFTAQIPQFLPKALSWKMPHWLLFSHDRHLRIHPIKLCHLLNTRLFM